MAMTAEEADKAQDWRGMDGAIAWHLIERHADDWNETGEMMNAWLRANVRADREACAALAEETASGRDAEAIAEAIRKRSNAGVTGSGEGQ